MREHRLWERWRGAGAGGTVADDDVAGAHVAPRRPRDRNRVQAVVLAYETGLVKPGA